MVEVMLWQGGTTENMNNIQVIQQVLKRVPELQEKHKWKENGWFAQMYLSFLKPYIAKPTEPAIQNRLRAEE